MTPLIPADLVAHVVFLGVAVVAGGVLWIAFWLSRELG